MGLIKAALGSIGGVMADQLIVIRCIRAAERMPLNIWNVHGRMVLHR